MAVSGATPLGVARGPARKVYPEWIAVERAAPLLETDYAVRRPDSLISFASGSSTAGSYGGGR